MVKKFISAVDAYKSKSRDRKRRGADIFHTTGQLFKTGHRRKSKKHSYSSKKTYTASTTKKNTARNPKTQNQVHEPMTGSEFLSVCVFLAIIVVLIILICNVGFLWTILISLVVLTVAIIISVTIESKKAERAAEMEKYLNAEPSQSDRSNQVPYIKSLLTELKKHQNIANTSSDPDEVKKHLDCLLGVIDEIMTFDESILKQAGMTKSNAASVKEDILKVYDIMIAQAGESDNTDSIAVEKPEEASEEEPPMAQPAVHKDGIIPLETLLKVATPSKQGLYPHEILMLHYANTYKVGGSNSFQSFWLYQYSVENPQAVLNSLLERGFLVIGDLKSALERQKVVDLKAELQAIGEKASGKKAEIVERLLNSGNSDSLEAKYSERYYALTDVATKDLEDNEYVLYLHRTRRMSVWDMNYLLHNDNPSHLRYRDILWREFNIQSGEHFKAGDMGLYRNTRLTMYQFLMEENRLKSAFNMLCEVVAYDLSGMGNQEIFHPSLDLKKVVMECTINSCFPYSTSSATIPPAVVDWMANLKEQLALSETEFRSSLLENFEKIQLFRRIFTNEECVEIVMNEIGNHPRKQSAIYKQAEERMKQELESLS